jgi:hypothetical protein
MPALTPEELDDFRESVSALHSALGAFKDSLSNGLSREEATLRFTNLLVPFTIGMRQGTDPVTVPQIDVELTDLVHTANQALSQWLLDLKAKVVANPMTNNNEAWRMLHDYATKVFNVEDALAHKTGRSYIDPNK